MVFICAFTCCSHFVMLHTDTVYVCICVCVCTYLHLSHALKNIANQRPGLPLHILRYAMGNMQRAVFHSTFPSLYLLATVYWGPFEDFSKATSETLQLLRTTTNISDHVRKFSEDFRRFSENFKKS